MDDGTSTYPTYSIQISDSAVTPLQYMESQSLIWIKKPVWQRHYNERLLFELHSKAFYPKKYIFLKRFKWFAHAWGIQH